MSTDAGLAVGESITDTTVGNLVRTSIEGLDPDSHIQLSFADAAEDVELRAPLHGLAQAIRGILKNAIDASHGTRPAECHVSVSHNECVLSVQDHGAGMDAEMLRRVGEPFFTTKQTGMGTGLGVFLARNAIEGLGGNLDISSSPGTGTRVVIRLPLSPSRERPWDKYPLTGRLF